VRRGDEGKQFELLSNRAVKGKILAKLLFRSRGAIRPKNRWSSKSAQGTQYPLPFFIKLQEGATVAMPHVTESISTVRTWNDSALKY